MSVLKQAIGQVLKGSGESTGGRQVDMLVNIKQVDAKNGKILVTRAANEAFDSMEIPSEFWVEISSAGKEIKVDAKKAADADFVGNKIDAKMANYFEMFAKDGLTPAILEKMVVYPGQGTVDKPFPVRWVNNIPGGNPDKVLAGKVTVSGYYNEDSTPILAKLQVWSPKALTLDELATCVPVFDDSAQYSVDSYAAYKADPDDKSFPVRPSPAVAFIAIVDGQVVDFSPTLSYNPEEKRNINGQEVMESAKDYVAMMAEAHPGATVQAVLARDYKFSNGTIARGALLTMMNTKAPYSIGGNVPRNGNSVLAAQAVVALSPGKLLPSGARKGDKNDFVMNVYAGGAVGSVLKGHVFDGLRDAGDNKLVVHEALAAMTYPTRPSAQNGATQQEKTDATQAQSEGGAAQAKDPLDEDAAITAALNKAQQSKAGTAAGM